MSDDCLFCKIERGEIPARMVYEDELAIAFEDINPQAPTHILVIPRAHIATLDDLDPEHAPVIGHLVWLAAELARRLDHAAAGYRVVFNCNAAAGQTVFHIHLHLLAGRTLAWPPG